MRLALYFVAALFIIFVIIGIGIGIQLFTYAIKIIIFAAIIAVGIKLYQKFK